MALTQNQQKAIAALLSSPSREDAARKCGHRGRCASISRTMNSVKRTAPLSKN